MAKGDKLTAKQERFALNIFQGMSQRDAYREAGYSVNYSLAQVDSHACVLANSEKVLERLRELRDKAESEAIASVRERKKILSEIARGKITQFVKDNKIHVDIDNLDSSAVCEVTTSQLKLGKGENVPEVEITKLKLNDPIKAIDVLNKMDKIYSDGAQLNLMVLHVKPIEDYTDEELDAIIDGSYKLLPEGGNNAKPNE